MGYAAANYHWPLNWLRMAIFVGPRAANEHAVAYAAFYFMVCNSCI